MKKFAQISTVLLATTVLLAGCGGGEKVADKPAATANGSKERVKLSLATL
ncbi:hypothetical protein AB4Z22_23400 [Paenibacillus sp. TAF58]